MDLILWRHAQAQEREAHTLAEDWARALTPKGEKQAKRMAKWLDRQLPDGARILVSPARRAEQTATALGRKFKTHADLAPEASAAQLLALVQWPHAGGTVLVVGHQPTLGQAVAQVLGWPEADCAVAKGALWWLRSADSSSTQPAARATLVTVQTPALL